MDDTLRSLVEEMRHRCGYVCSTSCFKCRLEALLAEYEVDLVKKWREEQNSMPNVHGEIIGRNAAELETWLAVNLERIKREACDGMLELIPSIDNERLRTLCMMKNGTYHPLEIIPATLADEIEQRIAAQAQAKEKP